MKGYWKGQSLETQFEEAVVNVIFGEIFLTCSDDSSQENVPKNITPVLPGIKAV